MRIAFISYEYPNNSHSGGIGTYIHQTSNLLADRGHDITVFTCGKRSSYVTDRGVNIIEVEEFDRRDFAISAAQAFLPLHKKNPFDVIEAPDYNADGRKIKKIFPELPYLLRMHAPTELITTNSSKRGLFKELTRIKNDIISIINYKIFKRQSQIHFQSTIKYYHTYIQNKIERKEAVKADIVVCPSLKIKNYTVDRWKINSEKVIHSPNPYIPCEQLLSMPSVSKNEKLCVGFVGRICYLKGIDMVAQAIPLVLKRYPNITFCFVGAIVKEQDSGLPYDEWIKRKLPSYANNLIFTGRVNLEKVHAMYSKMDIVLVPSVYDNFPTVCLEAMSAARPVIGTRSGGMEEMITHEENGLLIEYGDHKELARQIIKLCDSSNSEFRSKLGKRARSSIINRYNSKRMGKELESLYKKAIRVQNVGSRSTVRSF